MFHTITLSHAEWGYITNMPDWTGGRLFKAGQTPDGRHLVCEGFDGTLMLGVTDKSRMKQTYGGGYGYVRPWDENPHRADAVLEATWDTACPQVLDYYVAQRHGSPCPEAVPMLYPERVFVHGEDEEGNPLSRAVCLRHLQALDLRGRADFWLPCQIFHGMTAGVPQFHNGLRAHTDMGCRWYEVFNRVSGKLPSGYSWEFSGANYGDLIFDDASIFETD